MHVCVTNDVDNMINIIKEAINKADIATIPRKKYKSISKRLPPELRHLVRVKRKLVKDVGNLSEQHVDKDDLIGE